MRKKIKYLCLPLFLVSLMSSFPNFANQKATYICTYPDIATQMYQAGSLLQAYGLFYRYLDTAKPGYNLQLAQCK